jgi:hypothetical protein
MTKARDVLRIAILCLAGFGIVNVAFRFLSGSYFDSHHEIVNGLSVPSYSEAQAAHIRGVFAIISAAITAGCIAAAALGSVFRHALAALLGVVNLVAGVASFLYGLSGALTASLLITGALMPVLAWFSYRRARGPWAVLVAICGVLAICALFGAPKIRHVLDVSLWTTMLLPGLFAVACISLALQHREYVDRTTT